MSLCYNPTANTITVNIIKARNLKAMDIGGTSGREFFSAFLSLTHAHQSEAQARDIRSSAGFTRISVSMFKHFLT